MRSTKTLFATMLLLAVAAPRLAPAQVEPRPVKKGYKRAFTINSSPQQAAIYLDDRKYGVMGYTPFKVTLVDGDYKLILELRGYKTEERTIRVQRGIGEQMIVLQREVQPGALKVVTTSDPNLAGAMVVVDGQPQGAAPKEVKLGVGRHLVEISKEGFLPFSQWVEVEEAQVVTLAPSLKAIVAERPQGSLLIDSEPSGAEVAVDGRKFADRTPTLIDSLSEGVHVVEVSKPPAKPYKDTVFIKGGERTKLTAKLEEPAPPPVPGPVVTPPAPGTQPGTTTPPPGDRPADKPADKPADPNQLAAGQGGVRVSANVEGAELWLDNERKGLLPMLVKDLPPGPHAVEVRAAQRTTFRQKVEIEVGKVAVVEAVLAAPIKGAGILRVVSPLPEAVVYIDGARAGVSPVEKEIAPGKHFIMVTKEGFANFQKEVQVEAGATVDLTANLLAGGSIRVISKENAKVFLDGKLLGPSPADAENIEAGEHLVSVQLPGYEEFRTKVLVKAGLREIVNADLKAIYTGPSLEELQIRQRGISTWGARPMAFGNFALDVSAGYPVWSELRATVGVSDAKIFGWDLGIGLRSFTNNWELYLTGRTRFFQSGPFSLGAFALAGGGSGSLGRNSILGQVGALATINLADVFSISWRVFADIWSDQLCPEEDPTKGRGICQQDWSKYEVEKRDRIKQMTGATDPSELKKRSTNARFYLSLALEGAITQHFSLFLVIEGAPAQGERAMHSELFNERMLGPDPIYNGRLGFTFKY